MSVYPIYLVLGSDGTIGAYAREDVLKIDLLQKQQAGQPARQVFRLNENMMTVTYEPAPEYAEFIEVCTECEKKQKATRGEPKMRCGECNKFAAYDDSTEPEVDVDLNQDGTYSGQVRIVLTHDECGQELKEATFDFDGEIPEEIIKGDGHGLDLEADSWELTSRGEGSGRYMKTFYGYDVALDLRCRCQERGAESLWQGNHSDDIQASHMDELV